MKRVICTVAALMVASIAVAGTAPKMDKMTPQQAMETMSNCPVCSVWMQEPALGPTIRHNAFTTKTGYVETVMTADQNMMPVFAKSVAECDKRVAGMATMTPEQKDKLCPLCIGHMSFMSRKDVTVEKFNTDLGMVVVASASSPEGVKALHEYAANSKQFSELMAKAGKEMGKEPMKSKM